MSAHNWLVCALVSTLASSQSRNLVNHALAKRNSLLNSGAGFFKLHPLGANSSKGPVLCKLRTLKGLGVVVAFHVICRTVLDFNISLLELVGNEETPVVDVLGSLAHALHSICFELDGTGIVLLYDNGFRGIS